MIKYLRTLGYFLPWISFLVFSFPVALLAAPILSLSLSWNNFRKGCVLDWAGVFVCLSVWLGTECFGLLWMEEYFSLILASTFFLVSSISLLIGKPFTLQYAKMETSEKAQQSPVFFRINQIMTLVFSALFLWNLVTSLYPLPSKMLSPWTFWALTFAFKSAFIHRFPKWYVRRYGVEDRSV